MARTRLSYNFHVLMRLVKDNPSIAAENSESPLDLSRKEAFSSGKENVDHDNIINQGKRSHPEEDPQENKKSKVLTDLSPKNYQKSSTLAQNSDDNPKGSNSIESQQEPESSESDSEEETSAPQYEDISSEEAEPQAKDPTEIYEKLFTNNYKWHLIEFKVADTNFHAIYIQDLLMKKVQRLDLSTELVEKIRQEMESPHFTVM